MYKLSKKQKRGICLVGSALSLTCLVSGFGFKYNHGFDVTGYNATIEEDHSLNNFLNGHKNDVYHLSWPDSSSVSITRGQLDYQIKNDREYYILPNGKKVYIKSGLDPKAPLIYFGALAGSIFLGLSTFKNDKSDHKDDYRNFNDYEEYYSNEDVKTFKKTR